MIRVQGRAFHWAFAIVLSAGLSAWACSDTSKEQLQAAGLAKGCTLKSDCKSPLVCVFQLCHDECKDTSDCLDKYGKDSGARCVSGETGGGGEGGGSSKTSGTVGGVCTFPAAVVEAAKPGTKGIDTSCKSSKDCPGAEHCAEDDQCRDGCASDADCLGTQVCTLSGACAEKTEVNADKNLKDTGSSGTGGTGSGTGGQSGTVTGGGGAGDVIVNECNKPAGDPVQHEYEQITQPVVWNGFHHITNYISVESSLTLAPCTVLEFDTNAYMYVSNNGSLKALGTDTNPVVFTSDKSVPKAGDWGGIAILADASNDSSFKNAIIEYSGNGYSYGSNGLQVADSAAASFQNLTVRYTGDDYCAIGLATGAKIGAFDNVRIENSKRGLCAGADVIGSLGSLTSEPPIEVNVTTLTNDAIWKDFGVSYNLDSTFSVYAQLTLSPGVTVRLPANSYINVDNNGSLLTQGTASKPVTFTSAKKSPGAGDWGGILFGANASNNSLLENTVVEYGGAPYNSIYINSNATAGLSAVTVSNSSDDTCGVRIGASAVISQFDDVTFENTTCPLEIPASLVGKIGSMTADGGYIAVDAETISKAVTWKNFGIPYRPGSMTLNAALDLEAGVTMLMPSSGTFYINNNGALHANGTAKEHVTFDSYIDGAMAGDWNYIEIDSTAAGTSAFSYTDFIHGGTTSPGYGVLYINGRTVALDHCSFTDNNSCDIRLYGTTSKLDDGGGNVDDGSMDGNPVICP
jgi:hypothetical protein